MGQKEAEREINRQLEAMKKAGLKSKEERWAVIERGNDSAQAWRKAEKILEVHGTYKTGLLPEGAEYLINTHVDYSTTTPFFAYLRSPQVRIESARAKIWLMQKVFPESRTPFDDGELHIIIEKDEEKPTDLFILFPDKAIDINGEMKKPRQFSGLNNVLNFYQKEVKKLNAVLPNS
jgi:hypothetical protein